MPRHGRSEQALVGERVQELDGKEGIAVGLFMHQLRQRCGFLRPAAQRIHDQLPHVFTRQRCQADLLQAGPRAWRNRLKLRLSGWPAMTSLSR